MIDTPFVKSCKKMVTENDGSMIFPGTEHTVSTGSWKIIQLIAGGKTPDEIEKLVGKSFYNVLRHVKGQRWNHSMENSLLVATNTENLLSGENLAQIANESLAQGKKDLTEILTNASALLLDFLEKSNTADREDLREMLSAGTRQNLRLGVKALMSEQNFNQIKKEGGLK